MQDPARAPAPLWTLAAAYAAVTVAITWPLATRLGASLAGDYGDAAFVAWVMAWVGDHLAALAGGDPAAWTAMWQAPIFAPAPDALSFSEHFLAPSLQALPLLWASGNPLLGYNVVFLVTLTLTGVAAHLLTYHLSGSHLAGAVAGSIAAFNDYRFVWSIVHLHTLSIHWWIVALWALDRYVATRSTAALIGAVLATLALDFSSNYLLAYCAPFTVAFCLWSLARHGRLADVPTWAGLALAGVVAIAAAVPVALRYFATRDVLQVTRSLQEMAGNSASLAAYGAAAGWFGPLVILALVGALAPAAPARPLSRRVRGSLLGLAATAVALSFGPVMMLGDSTLPGPYELLNRLVPGFSGLRVPHRFVAIATVFLAVLAGLGAAWLARWRLGLVAAVVVVALATRTAWSRPFPIDVPLLAAPLAQPPEYLRPAAGRPAIYGVVAATPADAIVLELPFGTPAYEIRYTFFTRTHRRRIVNGYSGLLPEAYRRRVPVLDEPLRDPEASWAATAPATHVVVHTAAWSDDTGARLRAWLDARGARALAEADGAWLYEMPAR